jgi:hypothetical protein
MRYRLIGVRVGLTALVLALGVGGPGGSARAGDEDPDLIEQVRKSFKPLDVKSVQDLVADVKTQTKEELLESREEVARLRGFVMQKWKTYQRDRWRFFALLTPAVRATRATLLLASLEWERKDRIARLEKQSMQEFIDHYKDNYFDPSPENRDDWIARGRPAHYTKAHQQVQDWYRHEMQQEIARAKSGRTAADDMLDEIGATLQKEIKALADAREKIQYEIWNRGIEPWPEVPDEELLPYEIVEKRRDEMRIAALRTEHEAQVGETIEIPFQVWKGTKPYSWMVLGNILETTSWLMHGEIAEPGVASFFATFHKPGTSTLTLRVLDATQTLKEVRYTINVKGAPLERPKPKKKGAKPGGEPTPPPAATMDTPPVPISGTFDAVLIGGNYGLGRLDEVPKGPDDVVPLTPVPLQVSITPAGAISASVDYTLPASAMGKPSKDGAKNLVWKTKFDLAGKVDWTTGRTELELKNGHDENGLEQDVPGYGRWRQSIRVDYSATLSGWSIPSPQAASWLRSTGALAGAHGKHLETLGRPAVDGKPPAFLHGGFFGDRRGASVPGLPVKKVTIASHVSRSGYDGKGESVEDGKKLEQMAVDMVGGMGLVGWVLRIGGPPAPPSDPGAPSATPATDKGDLWGFTLWPERPVEAAKGETVRTTAMGVFSSDPVTAEDLSAKVTWTASPGLVKVADGQWKADAPGTYSITATYAGPDGPMTSTTTIVVK